MAEVLELRQTGRPDGRELVATQGVRVLGEFHDRDDEDRLVWLRGFPDLAALSAYHDDPALPDTDDVLLLRPVTDLELAGRSGQETLVTITIYHLRAGGEDAFLDFFAREASPLLTTTGARPLAILRTLHHENASVVVWLASFPGPEELAEHVRLLGRETRWTHDTLPMLTKQLARPPEQLQLSPTDRSLLR
jgi:hypothetical protein